MGAPTYFRSFDRYENRAIRKGLANDERHCYHVWKKFNRHYDVRDLVPDAVWHLPYTRPEPPSDPTKIINWGKPKSERKFPYYDDDYIQMMDDRRFEDHPKFDEFYDFVVGEWKRRWFGFFWYNGDELEYITGHHYMFLQYWKIPVADEGFQVIKPDFRDVHRTVFYAIESAKADPRCYGILYYSMRRIGKTVIALSDGFFSTTNRFDQMMNMQSKNDADGRKIFNKLIKSWSKLPKFLLPRDTGETDVSQILNFSEGKAKVDVDDRETNRKYLDGFITRASATETTLDGDAYTYIINDEVGKAKKPLDVNERWNINRECLNVGTKVVGFGYITSTIEDMEKYASKEAQVLWERSDPDNLDPIGRTDSGLYRLFLPAYYGLQSDELLVDENGDQLVFMDEWGYTNLEAAHDFIVRMYKYKKGKALLSFRRKYPLSIDDAFSLTDANNNFDKKRLLDMIKYNRENPESPLRRGNFMWKNGIKDSEVVWYPDENGKWAISWMPPQEDRNKWELPHGTRQRKPTRKFARMGVDPFDQSYVEDEGSKAAAVVLVKHHMKYPELDNGMVCVYLWRQEHPELFFEDMIKTAAFYSCPVLIENNKPGCNEHFRRRGWDGFAIKDPLEKDPKKRAKPKKGIPFTGEVKRQDALDALQAHILDHMNYDEEKGEYAHFPHSFPLHQALLFDPKKWTKYDVIVAWMAAVLAINDTHWEQSVEPREVSEWVNIPGRSKTKLKRNPFATKHKKMITPVDGMDITS
jgi:hypothetical protein